MRADRLVSILLWLQVRGQTSAAELAERLEVSERTILRDMDALTTAGIPVQAVRGRRGGWLLPEEYRTTPRWLSGDEIAALAVLSPASTLAALGMEDDARTAWLKLQAALPAPQREQAAAMRARIHVDSGSWKPQDERFDWLPLLSLALQEDRMVRLRYRRADGTESERVVAPLGLVSKGSTWYLVATVEGQIRTYRVSRIETATLRPEPAERPDGFDLAAYWESSKVSLREGLPTYPVTIRTPADALGELRSRASWARITTVGPVQADSWVTVEIMFEIERDAIAAALSLGDRCLVLAPDALRRAVIDRLHRALDRYADCGDTVNRTHFPARREERHPDELSPDHPRPASGRGA
jgi:predicted DNA-binding transcriptional regulator YafY